MDATATQDEPQGKQREGPNAFAGLPPNPAKQGLRLLHRVIVFAAAVYYVIISLIACGSAVTELGSGNVNEIKPIALSSPLIAGYAGEVTIRESPLVMNVLGNSTTPRESGVVYLESASTTSFSQCSAVAESASAELYADEFLRWIFTNLQSKTAYNITLMAEVELVIPVVDCAFDKLVEGDRTMARIDYLVRFKDDPERVLLLPASLSIQDYFLDEQYERGSALLLTLAVIEDMRPTDEPIDHYYTIALNYPYEKEPVFEVCEFFDHTEEAFWEFVTIPADPYLEPPKPLLTGKRVGFYIDTETSQFNIEHMHWDPKDDAASALSTWEWHGSSISHDSWAWVHFIHLLFALDVIFQLGLLSFLVYRNFREGRIWVGDAFAAFSGALLYRGIYVLVASQINGYWTLTEFCVALGDSLAGKENITYQPSLAHADLFNIYLNITAMISYLFRERIDPLLVIFCFELGFIGRETLVRLFPSFETILVDYANSDYDLGLVHVDSALEKLSPMRRWTVHAVHPSTTPLLLATFLSIFSTLVLIVIYVILRKLVRHSRSAQADQPTGAQSKGILLNIRRLSQGHGGENEEAQELMQFETATGAVLKSRFGIISAYDNYVVENGKRFASIDAIYGNGFIVANGKFLVATEDLFALFVMKITHMRFTNIFVYELITDSGVKQTARLVYPQTISWTDLANLSTSRLA